MNFSKAHFIGIAGKGMKRTALLLRQMGVPPPAPMRNSSAGQRLPEEREAPRSLREHPQGKTSAWTLLYVIVIGKNAKLVPESTEGPRRDGTAESRCGRLRICCTTC